MSTEKQMTGFNLDEEVYTKLKGYAAEHDISLSKAARHLLRVGLAIESSGLYVDPISQVVRQVVRGELELGRMQDKTILEDEAERAYIRRAEERIDVDVCLMMLSSILAQSSGVKDVDTLIDSYRSAAELLSEGHTYQQALQKSQRLKE